MTCSSSAYPDATFAYEVPNAFGGYELGYGEVADDYPAGAIGDDGAETRS